MKKTKKEETAINAAPAYQNQVTLVGYLGADPERHPTHTVLSLATKTSWPKKDSDDWDERTEWHKVVAWDKLAEATQPLAKGDYVLVEGRLRSHQYERDVLAPSGETATATIKAWEIRARSIRKLERPPKKAAA